MSVLFTLCTYIICTYSLTPRLSNLHLPKIFKIQRRAQDFSIRGSNKYTGGKLATKRLKHYAPPPPYIKISAFLWAR